MKICIRYYLLEKSFTSHHTFHFLQFLTAKTGQNCQEVLSEMAHRILSDQNGLFREIAPLIDWRGVERVVPNIFQFLSCVFEYSPKQSNNTPNLCLVQ